MKMTVHQRLRTQQRAEHARASWRRHRRQVRWFGAEGMRCYECCDIPLRNFELRWLSVGEQISAEEDRQRELSMRRLHQAEHEVRLDFPEPGDPKRWHWTAALGYWA